jgi:uncharacterized protein (DUF4415 family)
MSKKHTVLTAEELAETQRRRVKAARLVEKQLETMTEEEDARLAASAEADADNPPLTEENWRRMRPGHEVHPEWVRQSLRRGRPKLESPKHQVTLRIDAAVLDHFKAGGKGWQTAINETLKKAIGNGSSGRTRRQAALKSALRKTRAGKSSTRG